MVVVVEDGITPLARIKSETHGQNDIDTTERPLLKRYGNVGVIQMSVLLIDDDEVVRDTAVAMLTSVGIATASAASYDEAMHMLDFFKWDIVLADYFLGHATKTGVDILHAANSQGIPCAIMSGAADWPAKIQATGAEFLPKPFKLSALLEAVRA